MMRRTWALVLGAGLVVSVLGASPASAASKKRPDLVVSAVSVSPGKVVAGGVLKVADTTRNKGRKTAKRSVTRYALSKDKRLDRRDVVLANRAVKKLKPRKKHAAKRSVRVPAKTRVGTYWLLACADAKKKVRESRERNNCRVAKRRVTVTKRRPVTPKLPWEDDKPGQTRTIPVSARVTVSWKHWHNLREDGRTIADSSSATFDVRSTGTLMLAGGKPLYLQLYTFKSGTAKGTRTFREQFECLLESGEFRAGPESLQPDDGIPPAGWLVGFPHPQAPSSGVIGGVVHEFSGHGPLNVSYCGTTSTDALPLDVDASYSDDQTTSITYSKDLTRVTFGQREDIHDTETRKLGSSSTTTVQLTHLR